MTATSARPAPAKQDGAILRLAIDLGPLLVYFAAYWWTRNIILSTGIFMAATVVAIVLSRLTAGKVSALLWFSGAMVLVLGGLTVLLHNETFIKIKPTVYYATVATILFYGLWARKLVLKLVLGHAYPGLNDRGWALLSRNWALFFLALGVANEIVWRTQSTEFWLGYKLWGALPATVLFAVANIPLLLKHGMALDQAEQEPPLPPQG